MKKSKLFLTIALILALAVIFVACGETSSASVSGQIIPAATTSNDISSEIIPAAEATEVTEAVEATDPPVSLGRLEGGTYINNYAGFGCELDSNWSFCTAEELQELPANTAEMFKGSEIYTDSLPQSIIDMKAENANDLTSINVLYQKLTKQDRLYYLTVSEEDIINLIVDNSDVMIRSYEQAGIIVDSIEKVSITFLGEERVAMRTSAVWEGVPYFTLQIFDYHAGEYSVTTTFASHLDDETDKLLDLFFPVK